MLLSPSYGTSKFVLFFLAIIPFKTICNVICVWQLLDLPGIIEGAKDGKGRGRQVLKLYGY
jgi:GTPase involved in cell partitioning and DNA repair